MNTIEVNGRWGLPGEAWAPGTLSYQPGSGLRLTVLTPISGSEGTDLPHFGLLHGQSITGQAWTLCQSSCTHIQDLINPERSPQEYHVELAWKGTHLKCEEQTFDSFQLHFDELCEWAVPIAIKPEYTVTSVQAKAETSPVIVSDISGWRIEIGNSPRLALFRDRAEISIEPWIRATPTSPQRFEDFTGELLRPLQDLLSICSDRSVEVGSVRARLLTGDSETLERGWVEGWFESIASPPTETREIRAREMLFTLGDTDQPEKILKRWFEFARAAAPTRMLLSGLQYRPGGFLDQRFVYAIGAVESFHRALIGGVETDPIEHRARLEAILSSTPLEHQTWLKEKLQRSNDKSLRRRVEEMIAKSSDPVRELLGSIENFVRDVVRTRNYYAHYDPEMKEPVPGRRLLILYEGLVLLVHDLLIGELGFEDEKRRLLFLRWRAPRLIRHLLGQEGG